MIAPLSIAKALLAHWRVALVAVLLAAAAYAGYAYRDASADREVAELRREHAEALARNAMAALHATKKQERATEDADQNYQKRLADLRAYYERRLREQPLGGLAGQPGVPAVPATPGEPDAAAQELAACRTDLERLRSDAAADALQLWELQQWVEHQKRLNP